jgi:hypothetical protein
VLTPIVVADAASQDTPALATRLASLLDAELGSSRDAVTALRDARCTIACAPHGHDDAPANPDVVLGWDGSRESRIALETAVRVCRATGGNLHVVHAVEDPDDAPAAYRTLSDGIAAVRRRVPTMSRLVDGVASTALADAGADAGLVLCGSRGSTSLRLLAACEPPVALVTPRSA